MTYREAKYHVAEQLKNAGIENELAESGFLMELSCAVDRNFYLLHQMEEMPGEALEAFLTVGKKRCAHIPLQHLTGEQEFMGLTFHVNEHVLIPRQDTEVLVETALDVLGNEILTLKQSFPEQQGRKSKDDFYEADQPHGFHNGLRVLDLCTGSGCIAISLKSFLPEISVAASDISEEALAVARENAEEILCPNQKIDFFQSDLFSAISGKFDMIVSNPPYIPSDVIPTLMPEVREHEPLLALDGSADGLCFYREIIAQSSQYLNDGGWLLFEIGAEQGEAVSTLLRDAGFTDVEVIPDLAGLDRVVKGKKRQRR